MKDFTAAVMMIVFAILFAIFDIEFGIFVFLYWKNYFGFHLP